jgi:pimeloyl-ACP methyl ester carboxylesterase
MWTRALIALPYLCVASVIAFWGLGQRENPFRNDVPGAQRDILNMRPGWAINYIRGGDPAGQRVIYLHGTPGGSDDWADYVTQPIDGLEAISIDRPGIAPTMPSDPIPSLREQAEAIEPFLVERNGRWPILVGHSLGGPIVARAAVDYPDRVGGIVIVAGALDPDLEKVLLVQWLGEMDAVPHLLPSWLRNCSRELLPLKAELETLQPLLTQVKCPVIIMHDKDDSLVPYENVDFMLAHLPELYIVDVVTTEGKDHFTIWNDAETVRSAIKRLAAG